MDQLSPETTQATASPVNFCSEIVKVSRPGFWITQIWFYQLPFTMASTFDSVAFWIGLVYVCFPLGLLIYGWNDLGDAATDRLNQRKDSWIFGARPDARLRRLLPWVIGAVQVPFVVAFVWIAGPKMLVWLAMVIAVTGAYNTLGFKKIPPLDLLSQFGYLLIFVLANWLGNVPSLTPSVIWFCAIFAIQSHLFGELMDLEEDREVGRQTTAVLIGSTATKFLLTAITFAQALMAYLFFEGLVVCLFMSFATVFFLVDAIIGPSRYPQWFNRTVFIAWNIVLLASMPLVWHFEIFQLVH